MYYIYRITNKINGKTYIGQHKYKKLNDSYMGSGIHLKSAQKKYGMENFTKEILYSRIQYKETADDIERFAIAKERAIGKAEYNIADGGYGSAGFHHTEEYKRYMSKKMKGRYVSEETRMKLSKANKGKHPSEESIRKNREAHKGKHLTEEWKRKISEGNKGHKVSEETRKKISEAALNMTEEHKRKISEANKGNQAFKGRHHSDESKRKISEANKGKQCSEETRRKLVESHKGQTPWNKGKRGLRHWYNNGEISIQAKECPEGFVKGRLHIHH